VWDLRRDLATRGKGWAARPAHGLISVEHARK
jgi:hypothetical protein